MACVLGTPGSFQVLILVPTSCVLTLYQKLVIARSLRRLMGPYLESRHSKCIERTRRFHKLGCPCHGGVIEFVSPIPPFRYIEDDPRNFLTLPTFGQRFFVRSFVYLLAYFFILLKLKHILIRIQDIRTLNKTMNCEIRIRERREFSPARMQLE